MLIAIKLKPRMSLSIPHILPLISVCGTAQARRETCGSHRTVQANFRPTLGLAVEFPTGGLFSRERHERCQSAPGSSGPLGKLLWEALPTHQPAAAGKRGVAAAGKGAWRRGNSRVTSSDAGCLPGRAGPAALRPAFRRFWPSPPWVRPPGEGGDAARGGQ